MSIFTKWDTDSIKRHMQVCLDVLRTDPWHRDAIAQYNECQELLRQREKPKEPDICDIIMAESE